MSDDIKDRVVKLLVDHLGIDKDKATDETFIRSEPDRDPAVPDLGGDSLDVVELVMALEDEFNIEIPDDEVEAKLQRGTVKDYVDLVRAKLA